MYVHRSSDRLNLWRQRLRKQGLKFLCTVSQIVWQAQDTVWSDGHGDLRLKQLTRIIQSLSQYLQYLQHKYGQIQMFLPSPGESLRIAVLMGHIDEMFTNLDSCLENVPRYPIPAPAKQPLDSPGNSEKQKKLSFHTDIST